MRIALLLRYLDEQFQLTIFRGIQREAETLGIDLVCVQGETLDIKDLSSHKSLNFARSVKLDGVLLLSSVIFDKNDFRHFPELSGFFDDLPCVSIGLQVPDLTSIVIRNRSSMKHIMDHLIVDHGYRRLMFISGTKGHHDSNVREEVFRQAIAAHKKKFSETEGIVCQGAFSEESGVSVVNNYIANNPGRYLDAIVAANDNMAIGALKALRLQDDDNWQKCAVTGFDDIPQAVLEVPALTSVRQPLEDMGKMALRTLCEIIEKKSVKKVYRIESEPVIRESCGCVSTAPSSEHVHDHNTYLAKIAQIQKFGLETERRMNLANNLGQNLVGAVSSYELFGHIRNFLTGMNVRNFYLLLFETEVSGPEDMPTNVRLMYAKQGDRDFLYGHLGMTLSLDSFFEIYATDQARPSSYSVYHLHSGRDHLGLMVYEVEHWAHAYMCSIGSHIANSIKRLRVMEEQQNRARQLESEVGNRTRDLRTINSLLEEEIKRRKAIESELRKHRETLETILDAMPLPLVVYTRQDGDIRYANQAFSLLTSEPGGFGDRDHISRYLDIPEPCRGEELVFRAGRNFEDDIPVLAHTADLFFEERECVIAGLVDLRTQKALEADVLRISEFERERFGLDLHDDICQRLAGMTIYSKTIAARLSGLQPDAASRVEELSEMIDATLVQTRLYAHASFPVELEDLGLDNVLRQLCETVARQTGTGCSYESNISGRGASIFHKDQEINIYRIVQEALQNTAKHANAQDIRVSLIRDEKRCTVEISDDGKTPLVSNTAAPAVRSGTMTELSVQTIQKKGMGFRSMLYRASQLGAQFSIDSNSRGGTTIRLVVPLRG